MNIQLNGRTLATRATTLAELLIEQQIDLNAVASAINGDFVPKSQYAERQLQAGDRLEVLSPMQGG
ncbi:sulfur carrier protein ThiS [Pantoea sp. Mb-10]|uniref:sulfur carrier protein ThiS n=1 Tax=unclassified Pantoea TaxID=2630326 RepID=UPI001E572E91|nr:MULTISPECIES: sulfur carrier protein ThiS [unclassified Pantoea]MCE0491128.1 sulfur carrier protein ThiS [Pantoea sp. Mb-10]MCE0502617.1 sulfur carrier protein ThiS [Pantoea sp. Pb-8]